MRADVVILGQALNDFLSALGGRDDIKDMFLDSVGFDGFGRLERVFLRFGWRERIGVLGFRKRMLRGGRRGFFSSRCGRKGRFAFTGCPGGESMGHFCIAAQLFQLAGCFGYDFVLGALASGLRQPPPSIEGDGPLKSHTDAEVFQPMLEAAHDFVVVLAYGKGFRHHVL